jgi:hypothetical protein
MGLVQVRVFYSWPHLHIYLLLWSSSLPLRENKAKSHLPPSAWVHRKRALIGIHKKHEAYALVTLPELHKLYTSPALLHILPRHWPRGQYRLARNAPLLSLLRSRDRNVPIPVPPHCPQLQLYQRSLPSSPPPASSSFSSLLTLTSSSSEDWIHISDASSDEASEEEGEEEEEVGTPHVRCSTWTCYICLRDFPGDQPPIDTQIRTGGWCRSCYTFQTWYFPAEYLGEVERG